MSNGNNKFLNARFARKMPRRLALGAIDENVNQQDLPINF
jgi:hypothetical protein